MNESHQLSCCTMQKRDLRGMLKELDVIKKCLKAFHHNCVNRLLNITRKDKVRNDIMETTLLILWFP